MKRTLNLKSSKLWETFDVVSVLDLNLMTWAISSIYVFFHLPLEISLSVTSMLPRDKGRAGKKQT